MGVLRDNLHGDNRGLGLTWRMSQQQDTGWGSTDLNILMNFISVNFFSVLPERVGQPRTFWMPILTAPWHKVHGC